MEIKSQKSINKGRFNPAYKLPTVLLIKHSVIVKVEVLLGQKLHAIHTLYVYIYYVIFTNEIQILH